MKTVMAMLTTGKQVPEYFVRQTLMHLENMAASRGVMPLYELVQLCNNPSHRPFGVTGDVINDFGLLANWDPDTKRAAVHDFTRDVVLAAIRGQKLSLSIDHDIVVSIDEVDV